METSYARAIVARTARTTGNAAGGDGNARQTLEGGLQHPDMKIAFWLGMAAFTFFAATLLVARVRLELVLGDCNRVRAADGSERPLFHDAFDLVAKTPAFYDGVVRTRLDERLARTDRYAAAHFGSADPYRAAIERNVERARRIAAGREALGAEPPTTTAHLDAVYHAGPAA